MKKDWRPNCRRINIDNVDFVVCSPEIVDESGIRFPQGEVKFRELDDGTLELIETKKINGENLKRVKKHLEDLGFNVTLVR